MIAESLHLEGERARDGARREYRWLSNGSEWCYGERTDGGPYLPRGGSPVGELVVRPSGVSVPQPDDLIVLWYGVDGWKRFKVRTAGPGAWSVIRNSWVSDRWVLDGLDDLYGLTVDVEWQSRPTAIRGP